MRFGELYEQRHGPELQAAMPMNGQFERKEEGKFTLVSDHYGSFLRRQPGANGLFDTAKHADTPLVLVYKSMLSDRKLW